MAILPLVRQYIGWSDHVTTTIHNKTIARVLDSGQDLGFRFRLQLTQTRNHWELASTEIMTKLIHWIYVFTNVVVNYTQVMRSELIM